VCIGLFLSVYGAVLSASQRQTLNAATLAIAIASFFEEVFFRRYSGLNLKMGMCLLMSLLEDIDVSI